jgi:hypothetical protein
VKCFRIRDDFLKNDLEDTRANILHYE